MLPRMVDDVHPVTMTTIPQQSQRLHLRVAWLCGFVLFLEGYDIAAVGYAVPSLVDAWRVRPVELTAALVAGNLGLLLGSLWAGLPGDRMGRKPVLITCVAVFGVFSLLSSLAASPSQLAALRFLTGLGLGGGIPLTIALASDFAPQTSRGRLVTLMFVGAPAGFAVGGVLASQLVRMMGWPAIFIVGGLLPLLTAPILALHLPESVAKTQASPRNPAAALFQNGLGPSTVVLWAINLLSLLNIYLVLLWLPAILHSGGANPSQAILGATLYALGSIAGPLLTASAMGSIGMEIVLTCGLAFGALCVLAIGVFNPPFWALAVLMCGAGAGAGCQAGIGSLLGLVYPSAIRSTGAGWALGVGRAGSVAGPLLGGVLLALGFHAHGIFVAASIPVFLAAMLMAVLGRLRRNWAQANPEF